MNNCKTCKHWTQSKDDYYHTADNKTGRCAKVNLIDSDAFDENEETYEMEFVCKTGALAFTSDSDGYAACLYTRADFGCVMHEQKGE